MTTWRDALTTEDHDLHQAAWLIFSEGVSVKTATDQLEDNKEAVKPLIQEIIDDDYLFDVEAPGNGKAPISAIYLAGEFDIREALPSLLELLEFGDSNREVYEAAATAIGTFGEDGLDEILAWADENDDLSLAIADLLKTIGKDNEKAYEWVAAWVEKDDMDVETYVTALVEIDPVKAEDYLADLSKNSDFSKDSQKLFRKQSREAKKQARERLEERLAQQKAEETTALEATEDVVEETEAADSDE